ncbi:YhbY family RNA-binding protein [Fructilactobacillus florum]|uniref:YhbY family RNA-binding protein n=1 Tax=Fructilactobacillus florum TaxID=640331 RepID=UPI000A9A6206
MGIDFVRFFSIGKHGLNQAWLSEVVQAVDRRELVKISLQQSATVTTTEVAAYITKHSQLTVVQELGRTLLLFCESSNPARRTISHGVFQL